MRKELSDKQSPFEQRLLASEVVSSITHVSSMSGAPALSELSPVRYPFGSTTVCPDTLSLILSRRSDSTCPRASENPCKNACPTASHHKQNKSNNPSPVIRGQGRSKHSCCSRQQKPNKAEQKGQLSYRHVSSCARRRGRCSTLLSWIKSSS